MAEMEWPDMMLLLKIQSTEIDEQFALMRDERKRYSAALGKMIAERQNAVSALNGSFDQRDELDQKIQVKIACRAARVFLQ